jgi:hypothetical protein
MSAGFATQRLRFIKVHIKHDVDLGDNPSIVAAFEKPARIVISSLARRCPIC